MKRRSGEVETPPLKRRVRRVLAEPSSSESFWQLTTATVDTGTSAGFLYKFFKPAIPAITIATIIDTVGDAHPAVCAMSHICYALPVASSDQAPRLKRRDRLCRPEQTHPPRRRIVFSPCSRGRSMSEYCRTWVT